MFLNNIAQPVLYLHESLNELQYAPLLLSNALHLRRMKFPKDWRGTLYTSQEVMRKIVPWIMAKPEMKTQVLKLNQKTKVLLNNTCTVDITMIPISHSNHRLLMFLIQDAISVNLLAICRSPFLLDTFVDNFILRQLLNEDGIDTLYIDDALYLAMRRPQLPSPNMRNRFNRVDLTKLLHMVIPRRVIGIAGERLPAYLHDLCQSFELDDLDQLL